MMIQNEYSSWVHGSVPGAWGNNQQSLSSRFSVNKNKEHHLNKRTIVF